MFLSRCGELLTRYGVHTMVERYVTKIGVRALAAFQGYVVHAPGLDPLKEEIAGVAEWRDLAAFITSPLTPDRKTERESRRKLYTDVLKVVAGLEGKGVTVLAAGDDGS